MVRAAGHHSGDGVPRPTGHRELAHVNEVSDVSNLGLYKKALLQTKRHAGRLEQAGHFLYIGQMFRE